MQSSQKTNHGKEPPWRFYQKRPLPLALFAILILALALSVGTAQAASFGQEEPIPERKADLGDAPDSSNHHGIVNLAYPGAGIQGNFPTVFDTSTGTPPGPLHHDPRTIWLGNRVSLEAEADQGPDEDHDSSGNVINNILDDGMDNADNDRFDDGWLNPNVRLPHCGDATLRVRIRKVAGQQFDHKMFLNVLIDGNRNGMWGDVGPCEPDGIAHEWIVQNFAIDPNFAGDHIDIDVPTVLILNEKREAPAWMRFTLSEREVPMPSAAPNTILPQYDGRGPVDGFRLGETEDLVYIFEIDAEPTRDLGDAPDSTNHYGIKNMAYPGVPGRFPTVYNGTPAGEGVGPLHHQPRPVGLGEGVTREAEADIGPDDDATAPGNPLNNILDDGLDNADNDGFDDGWLNPEIPLKNCEDATLRVRIRRDPSTASDIPLYLNVWKDGNNDGDWQDMGKCEPDGHSNEWIVQDYPIPAFAGPFMDIDVPTVLIYTERLDAPAWMRFTVSEQPAYRPQGDPNSPAVHPDGRGHPDGFRLGETEDVLYRHHVEQDPFHDLGDAPDTTNHHGVAMEAYPGVPARFPTVWEGPAPSGPMHTNPYAVWLGKRISAERDADLAPDMDPTTNILNNGVAPYGVNADLYDDGWLNREFATFQNCEKTSLRFRVSKSPSFSGQKMYLNVYRDGSGNGVWGERRICDNASTDPNQATYAHEWIVQNHEVNISGISGFADFVVGTKLVLDDRPDQRTWVRWMLSEQPVPELAPFEHDGSGPAHPAAFRAGETEDYIHRNPDNQGEPGKVSIDKTVETAAAPVSVGTFMTYSVYLTHDPAGTAPAQVVMTDILPAEVVLISPPVVHELNPNVAPLFASFDSSAGPSGAVVWRGQLSPGAAARIDFGVRVRHCPPSTEPIIRNIARVFARDGVTLLGEASKDVDLKCDRPTPEVELIKRVVRHPEVQPLDPNQPEDPEAEKAVAPGTDVKYVLRLNARSTSVQEIVVEDDIPEGVVATHIRVDRGQATIRDDGRKVIWRLRIGPDLGPASAVIDIRPTDRLECDQRVVNVARWYIPEGDRILHEGHSNRAIIYLLCADLGDAPDSTNHYGLAMEAYSGVPARFPTVFDSAPDRGPKHLFTRPVHLGRGVSEEREADIGLDADPTNNIVPPSNRANLDKFDDGLVHADLLFEHCKVTRIPVQVSIDPAVLATLPDNEKPVMFLNVWVDSDRSGIWQERYECPSSDGTTIFGSEHIVVDYAVDVTALGGGLHTLFVPTNWPVNWPAELSEKPAWMRITLSERPSNKTLDCGAGTCHLGDGRGYDEPFRFGETEDYRVRMDQGDPGDGADPTIKKKGAIDLRRNPQNGTVGWVAEYAIEYGNQGFAAAKNVVIVDELSGPQRFETTRSNPNLATNVSGNVIEYKVGNLARGARGDIGIRTSLPYSTVPGTLITNTVTIRADQDDDTSNNTSVVTLRVPLLPPVITYPTPGTTCTGTLTIVGRAQPNVTVDVTIVDVATSATVFTGGTTADAAGHWNQAVSLPDGEYEISATASFGGATSGPSPAVRVIVDSSLFWNPLSLRFDDGAGHVVIPRDASGRTDVSGWHIFLRRGTTYVVSLEICCDDPNAEVTLELGVVGTLTLTDPDNDGVYTATFTTPSTGPITGTIRICVICDLIQVCSDGTVLIDPEGTVFDITTGKPIPSSTVACMASQVSSSEGDTVFSLWPAADFGQINPQTTGADGYFSFFTPAGTFRLEVNEANYQPYRSEDLVVVDKPVHFDVPLSPVINEEADYVVSITSEGFSPSLLKVEPGSVVEFVNLDSTMRAAKSTTPASALEGATLKSTDAWDSGLLENGASYKRRLDSEGTYTYIDSVNPAVAGTIIVEKSEPAADQMLYLPNVVK